MLYEKYNPNDIFKKKEDPSISRTLKKQNAASAPFMKTRGRMIRYGILTVALAIITYFFPSPNPFNFLYSEGEPWHYAPLYSLYKFNINMSDSVLQMKQDSVKRDFEPYYERNNSILDSVKQDVSAEVKRLLSEKPQYRTSHITHYIHQLNNALDSVYKHGVISQTSYDSLHEASTSHIRVVDKNIATLTNLSDIFNEQNAYKQITTPTSGDTLQD